MKKTLLLLIFTAIAQAQIVTIPDANFKAKLLSSSSLNTVAKNFSGNYFKIDSNNNGEIDVAEAAQVYQLRVNDSGISSLEGIESFSTLVYLYCFGNQITAIDFTNFTTLEYLDCSSNLLTTLQVPYTMAYLGCSGNLLSTLDVSNAKFLTNLVISMNPQLVSVFIKNNYFTATTIFENPALQYICADPVEFYSLSFALEISGNLTCTVNSYCSFTPGGDYNTITGALISDANSNGCDTNDAFFSNIKIKMQQWGLDSYAFSNTLGTYKFHTTFADQIVEPIFENPTYFNASPASAVVSFPDTNLTVIQDFCITPNGVHPDLEIVLAPITPARPGFDATYKIVYKNIGNQTLSGEINFTYDDTVLDYINATPTQNNQFFGGVTWNYTNLLPFESRSIFVTLNVNSPTETPAINIDDALIYTVTSYPTEVDETIFNNTFQFNQIVVGSFDPNDITCLEGANVSPTQIGNYLHYVINFENTGTAAAENIVVKDIIDTTKFDISSLQVLDSSHPMQTRITNESAEFIFEGINLGASEHGNLVFKIKTKNTLITGNTVTNKADIYFDYNFPIETNIAGTTFQVLSVGNVDFGNAITIYPNPATSIVSVKADTLTLKSLQLYDVQGRLLINRIIENESSTIDISSYATGIYYLKVITDKGATTQKIVKK